LGPNSLGLLAPWQGLNASFSPVPIKQGKLAFISQSAAVSNTIWFITSSDRGFTWSTPAPLVNDDILPRGPVKNKLLLASNGAWI
ncbi:exo-alpha-sialidase, partial [Salmonella enterica subsp. enterica serovar Anatum]|nr:exo-alpha-sialidase [Salmonella enterica subsp. enterica serovar Anatum]